MVVENKVVDKQVITSQLLEQQKMANGASLFSTAQPSNQRPKLTAAMFDHALLLIFNSFKNVASSNYLPNRWLSVIFEDLLVRKQSLALHKQLFTMIKDFYLLHPFDLHKKLSLTFLKFFQSYPSLLSLVATGVVDINQGQDYIVKSFFVPHLVALLETEIILNPKYKSVEQIVQTALHFQIEKKLRQFDASYVVKNNKKLSAWIATFNDATAQRLKIDISSLDYFLASKVPTPRARLHLQESTFKNAINKVLAIALAAQPLSPLLEVVHHYVFWHFFSSKAVVPVEEGILENAQLLVAARQAEVEPKLEFFLPGLMALVKKFNLKYKIAPSTSGLVFAKIPNLAFLTPTDQTQKNFDFQFQLAYRTPYLAPSAQASHIRFKIPVKDIISPFQQATNIVTQFKETITWNRGYKNSLEWTEKEFVQWLDDFRTFKDFLRFVTNPNRTKAESLKTLKLSEWRQFSPARLESLDFSDIDSEFEFTVVPVIEFLKPPPLNKDRPLLEKSLALWTAENAAKARLTHFLYLKNLFGTVKVYLELRQYKVSASGTKNLLRKKPFQVRDATKIVAMPELISNLVKTKFPKLYNYDQWLDKGNQMWVNEWLNAKFEAKRNYKPVRKWIDRTNILAIKLFIANLITDINNDYRDNFKRATKSFYHAKPTGDNLPQKKVEVTSLSHDMYVVDTQSKTNFFEVGFYIFLKNMPSFLTIPHGPFTQEAIQNQFAEKLLEETKIINPAHDQYAHNQIVSDAALFQVGSEQISLGEIKNRIEAFGFKITQVSKVTAYFEGTKKGKKHQLRFFSRVPNNNYRTIYAIFKTITITYKVQYYDFFEKVKEAKDRKIKTKQMYLNVVLISEGNKRVITAKEMQKHYKELFADLKEPKKSDQVLRAEVDKIMLAAKKNGAWKTQLSNWDFLDILDQAKVFIENYSRPNMTALKISRFYDGPVPASVLEKLKNEEYRAVFERILASSANFSKKNMQKLFENTNLINLLKRQKKINITSLLNKYTKISSATKYAYFGSGLGLGIVGILAGLTAIRQAHLDGKTAPAKTKFKKTKTIAFLSLAISFLTIAASAVLTLLFFIEKGGF